jgi:hypothetical protein
MSELHFLTLEKQASFTALNVEPESDVEEDIDDSKELQVRAILNA